MVQLKYLNRYRLFVTISVLLVFIGVIFLGNLYAADETLSQLLSNLQRKNRFILLEIIEAIIMMSV